MGDIRVEDHGVVKLLLKLNPATACDPDILPARMLWYSTIHHHHKSATGRVPKDWRSVNVTAIFKKGEKYQPSNCRLVSPTCLCCKIQEHILPTISWYILMSTTSWQTANMGSGQEKAVELLTLADELVLGLYKRQQQAWIFVYHMNAYKRWINTM